MAKSQTVIDLEDTIKDIYDLVQESGTTRADMEGTLDQIATLCTDAVPDLDSDDEQATDEDEEE